MASAAPYAELDAAVDRTACALAGLGLRPGDRFALMATNSDRFVIAFYAALRCGAIVVPVNPASAPPEIAYLLEDSGAAVFAFDPAAADAVTTALKAVPTRRATGTSPPRLPPPCEAAGCIPGIWPGWTQTAT